MTPGRWYPEDPADPDYEPRPDPDDDQDDGADDSADMINGYCHDPEEEELHPLTYNGRMT